MSKKFDLTKEEVEDITFVVNKKYSDRILNIAQLLTKDLLGVVHSQESLQKLGFNIIVQWIGVALTDGYICRKEDVKELN
jgi:hypothetical protein